MKTTEENWKQALHNLHTRDKGISSEHQIDYPKLLRMVNIGKMVLDVGCGTRWLRKLMPNFTIYTGMDAFAGVGHADVILDRIEEYAGAERYNTLFVFAALDGMQDLEKAFANMKRLALNNIVILTGVEIEPDRFHTHKITREFIAQQMDGFFCTYEEYVHPKIVFLEYTRI